VIAGIDTFRKRKQDDVRSSLIPQGEEKMKNHLTKMYVHLQSKMRDEEGATMVEYALMVALIAVVAVAMVMGVGDAVNTSFSTINSALQP